MEVDFFDEVLEDAVHLDQDVLGLLGGDLLRPRVVVSFVGEIRALPVLDRPQFIDILQDLGDLPGLQLDLLQIVPRRGRRPRPWGRRAYGL